MPVLVGGFFLILAILGGYQIMHDQGEAEGKAAICKRAYETWLNLPIDQNGCGGSWDTCPIEPPRELEPVLNACSRGEFDAVE